MTRTFRRDGLALWTLLALLGAAGCTNSEVITSGRAGVELDGVPSPAVGSDYGWARIRIAELSLRPTDPTADQALGFPDPNDPRRGIGTIRCDFPCELPTIDLKSDGSSLLGQIALSAGQYRGTFLKIQRVELNTEPSTPTGTQCSGGNLSSVANEPVLEVDLSPSDLFVVPIQGQVVVELRVDGDKLVQLLQSHCVAQGDCTGNACTFPSASEFQAAGIFSLGE